MSQERNEPVAHIMTSTDCIQHYHQKTKHRFERYADGPANLDWSMQPDPFRRYQGAARLRLPLTGDDFGIAYCDLYAIGKVAPADFSIRSVGTMLELSLGLSAWKEYHGERWSLRCNPSSGNLHPTEAYVIAAGLPDLVPGVYHYVSYDHALEQRCVFNADADDACDAQPNLIVGLSSVLWREAWKYGERAYRYCQLDTGHALAAIRYACALLGWKAELLPAGDQIIEHLLGIARDQDYDAAEREHPDLLLNIVANNSAADPQCLEQCLESLVQRAVLGRWSGKANILDSRHLYDWPIIDEVAHAARTLNTAAPSHWASGDLPSPLPCHCQLPARVIIQRRRSAQRFDEITAIEAGNFFRILDMLIPRANTPPWDALPWEPRIHLVLFVHRVNGLEPGLYILVRNTHALASLKSSMTENLEWSRVEQAPRHLGLYCLAKADARNAAAAISCHQRIASDSALSLGMLSEYDAALTTGPWVYKQLYWEAGVLGQVLYLEAEAMDLQGTGIGCFFDDAFHELLGIRDTRYQSVYHFTVGGALNDGRLRTLLPYGHLQQS